jgi:bacterioferritin (cytochrome b1)
MASSDGRLPDFLIVGAPKAGTTAVAAALAAHPEVFVSPLKEPKFLSADAVPQPLEGPGDALVDSLRVRDLTSYRRLYRRAGDARAVGEASVDTLYFHLTTVPRIRSLLGSPRILMLLRDPVARAHSAWKQLVRDGRETASFEDGLAREARGETERWEFMWRYADVGRYADQVAAFTDAFPDAHVVLHDELSTDVPTEIGHAQAIANRIKTIGGLVPGSQALSWNQDMLQPPADTTDIETVIKGVIAAEEAAIAQYKKIITLSGDGFDPATEDLAITSLADEEEHRREFLGFLKELEAGRLG